MTWYKNGVYARILTPDSAKILYTDQCKQWPQRPKRVAWAARPSRDTRARTHTRVHDQCIVCCVQRGWIRHHYTPPTESVSEISHVLDNICECALWRRGLPSQTGLFIKLGLFRDQSGHVRLERQYNSALTVVDVTAEG